MRARLFEDLQVAVSIAYALGWRCQSEVLPLERRQFDLEAGTLRLDPGTTKNDDGRIVYLPPDVKAALAAQLARVDGLQKKLERIIPHVFPNLRGRRSRTLVSGASPSWASLGVISAERGRQRVGRPACREC